MKIAQIQTTGLRRLAIVAVQPIVAVLAWRLVFWPFLVFWEALIAAGSAIADAWDDGHADRALYVGSMIYMWDEESLSNPDAAVKRAREIRDAPNFHGRALGWIFRCVMGGAIVFAAAWLLGFAAAMAWLVSPLLAVVLYVVGAAIIVTGRD